MADGAEQEREEPLTRREKRILALLGMPAFALALSITVLTTYLPVLAQRFTSSTTVTGVIIAAEGAIAMTLPIFVGSWSDSLRTPIGGRLPFVLVGTPVLAVAVGVLGLVSTLWMLALAAVVFFAAYYIAYEPYRAMYPDLLEQTVAGRGQSSQALFRGAGTGLALVGGGLLFEITPALPFLLVGVLAFGTLAEFSWGMIRRGNEHEPSEQHSVREVAGKVLRMLLDHADLRAYFFANALWELSLAALKTFIVLYLTVGLGYSMTVTAGIIAVVVVLELAASVVTGKLGDRMGKANVVHLGLWVFGFGLLVPFASPVPWVIAIVLPFVAFGGGMILSMPYAVLIPLMPEGEHGLLTGFYSMSRGLGLLLGPTLAGFAVSRLSDQLVSTSGYAAMWLVCALAILASIPLMPPIIRSEERKRRQAEREIDGDEGRVEAQAA